MNRFGIVRLAYEANSEIYSRRSVMKKKTMVIIMLSIISMLGLVGCGSNNAPVEEVEEVVSRNDFSLETAERISDGYDEYSVLLPVNWMAEGWYNEIIMYSDVNYNSDSVDYDDYIDPHSLTKIHFIYDGLKNDYVDGKYSEELAKAARDKSLEWGLGIGDDRSAGEDITIADITFYTLEMVEGIYNNHQLDMYGSLNGSSFVIYIESPEANKIEDSDIQSILQSLELGALNNREDPYDEFTSFEIVYRNFAESGLEIIGVSHKKPVEEITTTPTPKVQEAVEYNFTNVRKLKIEGKWQVVSETGFGQAQPGAIVVFDGNYCNFYSPRDTYALIKDGDTYTLSVTSLLGESQSYTVNTIDKDNIVVANTNLQRVK